MQASGNIAAEVNTSYLIEQLNAIQDFIEQGNPDRAEGTTRELIKTVQSWPEKLIGLNEKSKFWRG